jgi:hypothetical protein
MRDPRYPVYVVSKGRWESRFTVRALEAANVPYRIVIEPQEYFYYAAVVDPAKILVLPFAELGLGSIPARNWIWEHSIAEGHKRHWILDDNISYFARFHRNRRYICRNSATFRAAEDFVDRYENVALAGMQYFMFAPIKVKHEKPFDLNTRIYSCILIDNALPFRWRGRYNEDTDLSLRVLKAGYCTVLFYAFLADKNATMRMKGGNEELYRGSGRLEMARSLLAQHPDVVSVISHWGRPQHHVDYRPFKSNALVRRKGVRIKHKVDNYGMRLRVPARGVRLLAA